MPRAVIYDERLLAEFELVKEAVTAIRSIRQHKNIPTKEPLTLKVIADANYHPKYNPVLMKMANLSSIDVVAEKDATAQAFIVKTTEYFVPLGDKVDTAEELRKLGEELTYLEGFLNSVMQKLSNERFVQSAPAKVVETEQAKRTDTEAKIKAIQERISILTK
jgi:valyl-tRNA synthetase